MKYKILVWAVLYTSLIFVASANAGVDATEPTQILNNGELMTQVGQLAEQIDNQIRMVEDMIHNTMKLPNKLGSVIGRVNDVLQAYEKTQGILHRLSNLDEEFFNKFYKQTTNLADPSKWVENYSEAYYELSEGMEKQAEKTLESLKVSAEDITDSGAVLEELADNAATADGRNEILQAGNDFLSFLGGELVKTRTLVTEQTKVYVDYAERERTIEDAMAEALKQDVEKWKTPVRRNVQVDRK